MISITSKDETAMLTMSKAAKALGISRTALRKWIRKLDIPTVSQGQALCLTPEDLEVIRKARTVRSPRNSSKNKDSGKSLNSNSSGSPALHDLQIHLREVQQREHELQLQNEVLLQEKQELNEIISAKSSLTISSSESDASIHLKVSPREEEDPLHFFPSGKDFNSPPRKNHPELWKIFLNPEKFTKTQNKV